MYSAIQRHAEREKFPLRVLFELTYRCNFKCVHCYIPASLRSNQKELTTCQVKEILDQLASLGCLVIGFTGGEVFLRKDIFPVIEHACRLGMQVVVLTNGSLIDRDRADRLARLPLNKIDISLHSLDERTFRRITGRKGQKDKVVEAIGLLRERRIPCALKTCGMSLNSREIDRISRFAADLGVRFRVDDEMLPAFDHSTAPFSVIGSFQRKKLSSTGSPRDFAATGFFPCGAGRISCAVGPSGYIRLCHMARVPAYSLRSMSVACAWKRLNDFVSSLKVPRDWQCGRCELLRYCSWCPGKSYLHTGDLFSCNKKIREQAERTRKRSQLP